MSTVLWAPPLLRSCEHCLSVLERPSAWTDPSRNADKGGTWWCRHYHGVRIRITLSPCQHQCRPPTPCNDNIMYAPGTRLQITRCNQGATPGAGSGLATITSLTRSRGMKNMKTNNVFMWSFFILSYNASTLPSACIAPSVCLIVCREYRICTQPHTCKV